MGVQEGKSSLRSTGDERAGGSWPGTTSIFAGSLSYTVISLS